MSNHDDTKSIDDTAAELGVTRERLIRWMDAWEWITIQDRSIDVTHEPIDAGYLVLRNGGARVTPKGVNFIRGRARPRTVNAQIPQSLTDDNGETPF